jgi:hypothetical protein
MVLYLAIAAIASVHAQLGCADAAREAARLIARGDAGTAQEAVNRIAPRGAHLTTAIDGDRIEVEVSTVSLLPALTISGKAFAVAEPEVVP